MHEGRNENSKEELMMIERRNRRNEEKIERRNEKITNNLWISYTVVLSFKQHAAYSDISRL